MTDEEYIKQLTILFSYIKQGRPFMTRDYCMTDYIEDRFVVFSRKFFEEHHNQWMWKEVGDLTKEEAECFIEEFMKKKTPEYGSPYTKKAFTYKDSYAVVSDIAWSLLREDMPMIEERFIAPKDIDVALLVKIRKAFLPRGNMTGDEFIDFFRDEIVKDRFSSVYDFDNF